MQTPLLLPNWRT